MPWFFRKTEVSVLYPGTVEDAKLQARKALTEGRGEAKSLSEILVQLPRIELPEEEHRRMHFGLVDSGDLQRHGVDISSVKPGTKCHVLAIFDGSNNPLHVRVLSREFMDEVDRAIVGDEKFASRAYQTTPENRIRAIMNLIK